MWLDVMSNLFPKTGEYFNLNVPGDAPIKITDVPRKMYILRNLSEDARIYIGTNNLVTTANGMAILPGEVVYLNTASDIWAISDYIGFATSDSESYPDLRIMIFN